MFVVFLLVHSALAICDVCGSNFVCINSACVCDDGWLGPNCSIAAAYNDCLDDTFCVSWAQQNQLIHIRVNYSGIGWGGLTVGAQAGMDNGDCWVFGVGSDGTPYLQDRYTTAIGEIPRLDASSDLRLAYAYEVNGNTTVAFSRLMNTGDSQDDVVLSGNLTIAWAFSAADSDTFEYHDVNRGLGEELVSWPAVPSLVPSAVNSLSIATNTSAWVALTWQPPTLYTGAISYDVAVSNVSQNGPYSPIATTTNTFYNITNLQPNINYYIQVITKDTIGNSSPTSLLFLYSSSSSSSSTNSSSNNNSTTNTGSSNNSTNTGGSSNNSTNTGASNNNTTSSPSLPSLPSPPVRPSLFSLSTSHIELVWTQPELNNKSVIQYQLQFQTNNGAWANVYAGQALRAKASNLASATSYNFRLNVQTSEGTSDWSDIASYSTLTLSPATTTTCPNDCSGHGVCSNSNCLCSLGYLTADCSVSAPFQLCVANNRYCIYWTYDANTIYVQYRWNTVGYGGMIFGNVNGGMGTTTDRADCWVFWVDSNNITRTSDRSSIGLATPSADTIQHLTNATGYQLPTSTIVNFQRLLRTGDSNDRDFVQGNMRVAYALSNSDSFIQHGGSLNDRGNVPTINFLQPLPQAAARPSSPVKVKIIEQTTQSVVISWESPIYIGNSPILSYSLFNSNNENRFGVTSPLNITNLSPSTSYTICIQAVNSNGSSICGNNITITTLKLPVFPPNRPTSPELVAATSNSITLQWNTPNLNGQPLLFYSLEYKKPSDTTFVPIYTGLNTSFEIVNLTPGTTYQFHVQATTSAGSSAFSPLVNYSTIATPPCNNNCSGHGVCIQTQCHCEYGYLGVDCSHVATLSVCYQDNQFCLAWTYNVSTSRFYGQVSIRTLGWFGLIIGADDGQMGNGDGWVFLVTNTEGIAMGFDVWSLSTLLGIRTDLDVTADLLNVIGYQTSSRSVVSFEHLFTTSDPYDKNLTTSFLTGYAFSRTDAFVPHQKSDTYSIPGGLDLLQPFFTVPPANPINVRPIDRTNQSVLLSWEPGFGLPHDNFTLDYAIYDDINSQNLSTYTIAYIGRDQLYQINNLLANTTYIIRLIANNQYGPSNISQIILSTLPNILLPPNAPTNITLLQATNNSLSLTWDFYDVVTNTANPAYIFTLELKNSLISTQWDIIYTGIDNVYVVKNLSPQTSYSFRLKITTPSGTSDYSPIFTFDTLIDRQCENGCNGNGNCIDQVCQCFAGYLGRDCSMKAVFTSCHNNDKICWSYVVSEPYVYFHMDFIKSTAENDGYGALLIGAGPSMQNGDGMIFYFDQGITPTVADVWTTGPTTPGLDDINNIEDVHGYINGDHLVGSWKRLLNTNDSNDKVISLTGGQISVGVAYGGLYLSVHSYASTQFVDFATGVSTAIDDDVSAEPTLVWIAFGGFILLGGLLMQIPFIYQSKVLGWLRWKKLGQGYVLPITWVDSWFFNILSSILDMSYAQLFTSLVYLACLIVYVIWQGQKYEDIFKAKNIAFATTACIQISLTLFAPLHNNIWSYVTGISFERMIKFHRWVGRVAILFIILHAADQINFYGDDIITSDQANAKYGFAAFVCFLVLAFFTWEPIRRFSYKLFLMSHMLWIPAIVLAIVHAPLVIAYLIPPLVLLILDFFIFRLARTTKCDVTEVVTVEGDHPLTKLTIKPNKPFNFKPGDYVFLTIPALSNFEFHPFTISCRPGQDTLTFHILNNGRRNFTQKLFGLVATNQREGRKEITQVRVEGPYGSLSVPIYHHYQNIYLVSGGIGVTPMISILDDMIYKIQNDTLPRYLTQINFVWLNRLDEQFYILFQNILQKCHEENVKAIVKLHFYATRKTESDIHPSLFETGIEPVDLKERPGPSATQKWHSGGDQSSKVEEGHRQFEVHSGHPDFDAIFADTQVQDPSKVAVLVCGPTGLVRTVQYAAISRGFHFHKETFTF